MKAKILRSRDWVSPAKGRDLASAVKNNSDAIVHTRFVYTYGASQVGRYQRQLVYEGFTTDEQGRQAIDALFIHTGGTSLGSFNQRFALPNELGSFTQTVFPIRYEVTTDPMTGKRDGLGARVPAGLEPKIFFVDSGSEYWDRGRVAYSTSSMDGLEDLPDPRRYEYLRTWSETWVWLVATADSAAQHYSR